MELNGIINEAEFFPVGTLSEALNPEVKDIISKWNLELEGNTNPVLRFSSLGANYINSLREIRNIDDIEQKRTVYHQMHHDLVTSLGYNYNPAYEFSAFEEKTVIPLLGKVTNEFGQDTLWIIQTSLELNSDEANDPLSTYFSAYQFTDENRGHAEVHHSIEKLLSEGVFELKKSPRFLLILGLSQMVLVEKKKWTKRSVLRIDLQEVFTNNDPNTLNFVVCLFCREARVPNQGEQLSDRLEAEAQRTANAVTNSLKSTVRDAIEILGQEVLDVTEGKVPCGVEKGTQITAENLSIECLRYMYRLLFLLYVEANDQLKILDKRNLVYKSGYSVESLRELESRRLRTQLEKEGTYIWSTLQKTLQYFFEGESNVLLIPQTKVFLLDPKSTPMLNSISIRNEAIQRIIKLLSLRINKKHTTRISYAKLGIGQLGAVYETLISFTGRIAEEDLIQIIPENLENSKIVSDENESDIGDENVLQSDDKEVVDEDGNNYESNTTERNDPIDKLAPSYFVPKSRFNEFNPESVVFQNNTVHVYPKGEFIYRLAGRDREKNASYYTPEPLARLLVSHMLVEKCKNLTSDEILELKILEPAMGSAAFLVETTNQLADIYLEKKQKETGQTIKQEDISLEKQKVRAFIADRNCFGVDINPIATELGAISLWLNGLHASEFSPWFGDQLFAGNSLLGGRRAAYDPKFLEKSKTSGNWLNQCPVEIGWRSKIPATYVWQWLLPAEDMANFNKDKEIREIAGKELKFVNNWRKSDFFSKFKDYEIRLLQDLSQVAESLFEQVANELESSRGSTNDEIELWPDKLMAGNKKLDYYAKSKINSRITGADNAVNTLPYKRLKTAMDSWSALWFWPIDKAHLLPNRDEFLQGMAMILKGGFNADGSLSKLSSDEYISSQLSFQKETTPHKENDDHYGKIFRETNVEALIDSFDWLKVAKKVAEQEMFVHFDLYFADILKNRGGFDLIVGNPPWIKPSWNGSLILSDFDPLYSNFSAKDTKDLVSNTSIADEIKSELLSSYVSTRGMCNMTSSKVMNPYIGGGQNNLYRCFIDLAFRLSSSSTYSALIHEDGHLVDKSAGEFRKHWYKRIVKHFHFRNELSRKNFNEVGHSQEFSLNIYRGEGEDVMFENFCDAFLAQQIDESYRHQGFGEVPGIKNNQGKWDTRGHKNRIVKIGLEELKAVKESYSLDQISTLETIFIQPITESYLNILKLGTNHSKFGNYSGEYKIVRGWKMKENKNSEIFTSGMIYVANPFYRGLENDGKTSSSLDITNIPFDYISEKATVKTLSDIDYRIVVRRRTPPQASRSLICTIIPSNVAHTESLQNVHIKDELHMLQVAASWVSLPFDLVIKNLRKKDTHPRDIELLPWINPGPIAVHHILRLSCLTSSYAKLWSKNFKNAKQVNWSLKDKRLLDIKLTDELIWDFGFRNDFERRMALVELDVLVAQSFGYTLEQLIEVYNTFYSIIRQSEANTWFDQKGQIIWTDSKALDNIGWIDSSGKTPSFDNWQKILEDNPPKLTCTLTDNTLPGGPRKLERYFVGPFDQCDRIKDYKRAWAHFERLKSEGTI